MRAPPSAALYRPADHPSRPGGQARKGILPQARAIAAFSVQRLDGMCRVARPIALSVAQARAHVAKNLVALRSDVATASIVLCALGTVVRSRGTETAAV